MVLVLQKMNILLFNYIYNCFIVIEIKVCELKKEHIGQIGVYMNYIDKHIKSINQYKTIGIIISRRDNHYYIEYSSDNRIYTRDYVISQEAFINYYNEIKNKLIDNEVYKRVKDYSKERNTVITYFEIGRLLAIAGGKYGDNVIDEYSKKLTKEVGKKYNRRTLFRMKQFYNVFSNEKVSTMWTQLTWSHLRLLFNLEIDSINYYIQVIISKKLSVRELEFKIKSNEYERLPMETKNKMKSEDRLEMKDLIPNPILIKNKNNIEVVTERILHNLILENIESFMKELGNAISFIGSEYKIKIGDNYHKIDLLLFNIKYNSYVVVELKVTEFKAEYISQVQKYMNYIDKNVKEVSNNSTIGILICKKENRFVIEYCSLDSIVVREYEFI